MALKISVFYKYVFPVYILKGIYFSLLRYFLLNCLIIKQMIKVNFRYFFVTNL